MHETDGVITPGLIDLHGHPEFNIFAAWEPPKQFVNRYAWRGSDLYQQLGSRSAEPPAQDALPAKTQLRYAEIRALVGGVTAIQGTGGQVSGYQRRGAGAQRRQVDLRLARSGAAMIDLPVRRQRVRDGLSSTSILDGIDAGEVDGLLPAPGRGPQRQRALARRVRAAGRAQGADPGDRRHPRHRAQRGRSSAICRRRAPSSSGRRSRNLRLYGETTRAADALDARAADRRSAPTGCRAAARACWPR